MSPAVPADTGDSSREVSDAMSLLGSAVFAAIAMIFAVLFIRGGEPRGAPRTVLKPRAMGETRRQRSPPWAPPQHAGLLDETHIHLQHVGALDDRWM